MVAYAIVDGDAVYRAVDISEGMKDHPRDAQPETVATRQDDGSVGAIGLCQQRRYETTALPGRQVRNDRKNARISSASASGCSKAAKWPPRAIGVQRWIFSTRSASERGGRMSSRGKAL